MSLNKIQMLLLAGANNVNRDTAIFHQWERGEITTAKCLKMFRQNNRQNDRIDISQEDFEKWLNSLGYIRRKNAETYTEDQAGTHKGVQSECKRNQQES